MKELLFPEFQEKRQVTIQIEAELLKKIRDVADERSITLRQVFEFSLKLFLEKAKNE